MKVFLNVGNEFIDNIHQYKKKREFISISIPVSVKGYIYREIAFEKPSFLKKRSTDVDGILFLDSENKIVMDKSIIKNLSGIFYNLVQLLDDSFISSLEKTIMSDRDLLEEEKRYNDICKAIQILIDKNIPGAEKVDGILKRLTQYKKENNILIKQYLDIANSIKASDCINDEFIMNDLKQIYNLTLIKNFERIKFISTGKNYYGSIKKEAAGLYKKRAFGIMGSNASSSTTSIEYVFNHLIQVLDVYSIILDMSENDYIKYLDNIEEQNIEMVIKKNRAL